MGLCDMSYAPNDQYSSPSKVLHWLSAFLIIALIAVGWWMTGLSEDNPIRGNVYNLHKALGAITVVLLIARLAWFRVQPPPGPVSALPRPLRRLNVTVKVLLYALMLVVPLSGYVMSNAAGHPVSMFGLFSLPSLVPESRGLAGAASTLHTWSAYVLLALIGVHVAGSVKHRLTDRGGPTDVLQRMT